MISKTRAAVLLAFALHGALALAACSDVPAGPSTPGSDEPSAVDAPLRASGEFAMYGAHYIDGTGGRQYFLRDAGSKKRLYFATPPDVAPGAKVEVRGTAHDDGIDVVWFKIISTERDEIGSVSSDLIGVEAGPPRDMCVYMVDLGTGMGKFTESALNAFWFTAQSSINAYYQEISYGKISLTGKALGPFMYSMSALD